MPLPISFSTSYPVSKPLNFDPADIFPGICLNKLHVETGSSEAGMRAEHHQCSSFQSLSHVQLFATPWTAARQASLSITNSWSLLKFMSIESVMPSKHLILCHPLLPPPIFPSIRVFSNESALCIRGGQRIEVSASASVLPMNIQD